MTTPSHSAFADLGAHPSLARTLTDRGYETALPVQAMVLGAPEKDLLVSSQTGSGKTVAFGLLLARTLLGTKDHFEPAKRPRALVVTPTRELAAQVRRELEWLYAGTRARIVSFTGGTEVQRDHRTLKSGCEIVVGTPGRLVDLLERKSLILDSIEMVVLDEADEMLDLGFREALETLLKAAPKTRRTLLFSATLPPPIRQLAKRYQHDPVALDPRSGAPKAHEDIRHVAYLCASGDKRKALVNLLRMGEGEQTIVFCRTRESVADLHRELVKRGFAATAISGERAQAERNRALEALHQGRACVLVATNVAARGLDLPDVRRVIHADLPDSPEALTHRSGRTGRAGKKGDSFFIVEVGMRRRAERLFAEAHLPLRFSAVPGPDAIAAQDRDRLRTDILTAAIRSPSRMAADLAAELLTQQPPDGLVACLLDRLMADRPAGEPLSPVDLTPRKGPRPLSKPRPHAPGAKPTARRPGGKMVLFQVNLGANKGAVANWILPLVCRRGGITRREVGAIRVADDRTYFEVQLDVADEFANNAAELDPRAPNVRIEKAHGPLPARALPSPPSSHTHPAKRAPSPRARGKA